MDIIERQRLKQMEDNIPDIWEYKNYLYIGAGPYRHHFFDRMKEKNVRVIVVEIDKENFDWLAEVDWLHMVYHTDIRDFLKFLHMTQGKPRYPEDVFDCVIWSHGIETISKEDGVAALLRLEMFPLVVHMTPYGDCGGNGNVSVWLPEDFKNYGYRVDVDKNRPGIRNSNLLAWKHNVLEKETR